MEKFFEVTQKMLFLLTYLVFLTWAFRGAKRSIEGRPHLKPIVLSIVIPLTLFSAVVLFLAFTQIAAEVFQKTLVPVSHEALTIIYIIGDSGALVSCLIFYLICKKR